MNENTETPTAKTGPPPVAIEPPPEPAPSWGRNELTDIVVRTVRDESSIVESMHVDSTTVASRPDDSATAEPMTAESTPADRTAVDGGYRR